MLCSESEEQVEESLERFESQHKCECERDGCKRKEYWSLNATNVQSFQNECHVDVRVERSDCFELMEEQQQLK